MLLRLGFFALTACTLVLAAGTAHAAKPKQAVFRVTLTATLTKQWRFTQVEEEGTCLRTTRGTGRWEANLSARRSRRIRAVQAGQGRVRFSGPVAAIAGSAVRSGTSTVTTGGDPPCERSSRSVSCRRRRAAFRGGWSSLRSPRGGVVGLGPLRGAGAIYSFRAGCPQEPSDIRGIRTDLTLTTAPLDAGDVFGPNIPRFFTTGDIEQVTTLEGDVEGRVTERVRWTLVFTRVSR
jgi:hypothetical protein